MRIVLKTIRTFLSILKKIFFLTLITGLIFIGVVPDPPVKLFRVLTDSMSPEMESGSLVIVKRIQEDQLEVGDVISFINDETVLTHRIVKITEKSGRKFYQTKGDGNNVVDHTPICYSQIEGKRLFFLPKLGWLIGIVQTKSGIIALFLTYLQITMLKIIINLWTLLCELEETQNA